MITEVDARLRSELLEFRVRYCCEDCAHFEVEVGGCSLGYRTLDHRARPIAPGDMIVFCKTFELA